MARSDRLLGMYLHLARASHQRRQPMVRDRLLLLAGVQAEQMGLEPISALCRSRILRHNARHLVRSWPTLQEALGDEQFRLYVRQLHRRYSQERVEHMLDTLGIVLEREREAYFDDLEYAAALLGTRGEAAPAESATAMAPARGAVRARYNRPTAASGLRLVPAGQVLVILASLLLAGGVAAVVTLVRAAGG